MIWLLAKFWCLMTRPNCTHSSEYVYKRGGWRQIRWYIYYDKVCVCVYVCHEKSSLPPSELSARGAKWATCKALPAIGRLWPSDNDDDVNGDGDDDDDDYFISHGDGSDEDDIGPPGCLPGAQWQDRGPTFPTPATSSSTSCPKSPSRSATSLPLHNVHIQQPPPS